MDNRKTRAGTACEIARIDKDRFNESVFAGNYPCAPAAPTRGASRLFDVDDVVALYLYGRLLERNCQPSEAGSVACRVRDLMRSYPEEALLAIGYADNGASYAIPAKDTDPSAKNTFAANTMSPLIYSQYFNVANIRALVTKGLDEAALNVGSD